MSPSANICQGMSSSMDYLMRQTLKAVIEIGPTDMAACDNCSGTITGKHFKAFFQFFLFNSWTNDLISSVALLNVRAPFLPILCQSQQQSCLLWSSCVLGFLSWIHSHSFTFQRKWMSKCDHFKRSLDFLSLLILVPYSFTNLQSHFELTRLLGLGWVGYLWPLP